MLTEVHKQELRDKIMLCRKLTREAIDIEWTTGAPDKHRAEAAAILAKDAWKALDDWIYKEL